jgi:hypothetical protein
MIMNQMSGHPSTQDISALSMNHRVSPDRYEITGIRNHQFAQEFSFRLKNSFDVADSVCEEIQLICQI